tara:strand:+ start:1634 stop:2356 length:723 start_codon:yes stop_codon:yes gene_type:complete
MKKKKRAHKFNRSLYTFFKKPFSQLLISLIILFVARPYDRGAVYSVIWEFALVMVFVSAIVNCHHSKAIKNTATIIGIPAIFCEWANFFYPDKSFITAFLILMISFIFITTASIIKQVVINARVKLETLRGVVCAYFMVGIGFSLIYLLVNIVIPGSFQFSKPDILLKSDIYQLSHLMYFSFVTLLSIGYGDIVASKDFAQTCVIMQGMIGQFYIAILVSRLVGVYSFFEHKLHLIQGEK